MRHLLVGIVFTVAFFSLVGTSKAYNFSFMSNSPAFYFQGNDQRIMEDAAVKTLDTAKDGQRVSWSNPDTTAKGYFIVLKTFVANGDRCRTLQSFTDVKGMTNVTTYKFCRIKGDWRIVN